MDEYIMGAAPPTIIFHTGNLKKKRLKLDGKSYRAELGAWAFYVPKLRLKLFHTDNSLLNCRHPSAPEREAVEQGNAPLLNETYSIEEWQAAYSKPVIRRTAENYVAAKRLHEAGLGPMPLGVCLVMDYQSKVDDTPCVNAGIFIDNLNKYPPRPPVTVPEMLAAGVRPDKILSCIRQQINGYVSDLNSVVGVMPIDAEEHISRLEVLLHDGCRTHTPTVQRPTYARVFQSMKDTLFVNRKARTFK